MFVLSIWNLAWANWKMVPLGNKQTRLTPPQKMGPLGNKQTRLAPPLHSSICLVIRHPASHLLNIKKAPSQKVDFENTFFVSYSCPVRALFHRKAWLFEGIGKMRNFFENVKFTLWTQNPFTERNTRVGLFVNNWIICQRLNFTLGCIITKVLWL